MSKGVLVASHMPRVPKVDYLRERTRGIDWLPWHQFYWTRKNGGLGDIDRTAFVNARLGVFLHATLAWSVRYDLPRHTVGFITRRVYTVEHGEIASPDYPLYVGYLPYYADGLHHIEQALYRLWDRELEYLRD